MPAPARPIADAAWSGLVKLRSWKTPTNNAVSVTVSQAFPCRHAAVTGGESEDMAWRSAWLARQSDALDLQAFVELCGLPLDLDRARVRLEQKPTWALKPWEQHGNDEKMISTAGVNHCQESLGKWAVC